MAVSAVMVGGSCVIDLSLNPLELDVDGKVPDWCVVSLNYDFDPSWVAGQRMNNIVSAVFDCATYLVFSGTSHCCCLVVSEWRFDRLISTA